MIGTITPQIKEWRERLARSRAFIKEHTPLQPQLALLLDAPFGGIIDQLQKAVSFNYSQVPYMPCRPGLWDGALTIGKHGPRAVAVMRGPMPLHEGFRQQDAVIPIRVLQSLMVPLVIMAGTVGAVRRDWAVGDLMVVTDHINLTGRNPLIGVNDPQMGNRLVRLDPPNPQLLATALELAGANGLTTRVGTLADWQGPVAPTRAEVDMLRRMGADGLTMSFWPEVAACGHGAIWVLQLMLVTHHVLADAPYPQQEEINAVAHEHAGRVDALLTALAAEVAV